MYIDHYISPLGPITMASDGDALTGLWFDGQKYFGSSLPSVFCKISEDLAGQKGLQTNMPTSLLSEAPEVFRQTKCWLDQYFRGEKPDFIPSVKFETTPFRRAVWEILLAIPYGQTIAYGEIARILTEEKGMGKMSAQAVGGAVGHNPISIIVPCHRVVGSNGSLTGYAGGIERKAALLELEKRGRALQL